MSKKQQSILIEAMQLLSTQPPVVPIAPGIDVAGLTKPDTDAGREPFFVTLPLSVGPNAESRNGRIYKNSVLNDAIYKAIVEQRVGGNLGHTPEALAGTHFEVPVIHWVGAVIVPEMGTNVLYAKGYVPSDSPRMQELRGYYQRQAALGAVAGTSIEGFGYGSFNAEGIYEVTELIVNRIDIVLGGLGTGIPIAGSRTPVITTENYTGDLEVKAQENFRKLVQALSAHPDFKDVLYNNRTPEAVIEFVERATAAHSFGESPFIIPGNHATEIARLESRIAVLDKAIAENWGQYLPEFGHVGRDEAKFKRDYTERAQHQDRVAMLKQGSDSYFIIPS